MSKFIRVNYGLDPENLPVYMNPSAVRYAGVGTQGTKFNVVLVPLDDSGNVVVYGLFDTKEEAQSVIAQYFDAGLEL